jgi:hypothetical protein
MCPRNDSRMVRRLSRIPSQWRKQQMANLWRRGLYQRGQVGHSGLQSGGNRDKIVVTAIDEGSPEAGKLHVGNELIAMNGI